MTATLDQIEAAAQTGDLLFFSGRRLFSWLIRFRSMSKWSHVGFAYHSPATGLCVIESLEGYGVRCVPFSVWRQWRGDVGLYRLNEFHRDRGVPGKAVDFAIGHIGKAYASPHQFVRSFSLLWSRISHLLRRPDDEDPQRFFCSELVAQSLSDAGMRFVEHPARIKPGDLADDCRLSLVMETEP